MSIKSGELRQLAVFICAFTLVSDRANCSHCLRRAHFSPKLFTWSLQEMPKASSVFMIALPRCNEMATSKSVCAWQAFQSCLKCLSRVVENGQLLVGVHAEN